MSDQQQKTAQRQTHEHLWAAEDMTQTALRAWGDMIETITGQTAEIVERNVRFTDELASQVNRTLLDSLGVWRQLTHDSLTSWRNYLQAITDITIQNTRDVADTATRSVGQR